MKFIYPHQAASVATSQEIVSRGVAPRGEFRVATREQDELDAAAAKESDDVESPKDGDESFSAERAAIEFSLDE